MSNQYFKTNYQCLTDCRREGCSGHEIVLHIAHTSDTVGIEVDGDRRDTFDSNLWDAILRLGEQRPEDSFHPAK